MWCRLQTSVSVAASAVSSFAISLCTQSKNDGLLKSLWTSSPRIFKKYAKWIENWDLREPKSLVESAKDGSPDEQNKYNQELKACKPKATRHIILVRHGEYFTRGDSDLDKHLTNVGRFQAKFTGERLKAFDIKWDKIVASTQTRAQETAKIITSVLNYNHMENCCFIREGVPIPPEPPVDHWKEPEATFFKDGPRIEAGFRKYFYRADPKELNDTYTLLVGHGNVIRYFVCRALQFPPEAWLRMSLNHGSITWISILPSGRATLRALGDSGHIPPKLVTRRSNRDTPSAQSQPPFQ